MRERTSREAEAEFEELLRAVAHDVRGPVNQMRALAGMLCAEYKDKLNEDGQRLCEYIDTAAARAAVVIDAVGEYANALRTPAMETVDVNAVFERARSALADEMAQRGAVIRADDLGSVRGDDRMLTAVMQELLRNALKFNRAEVPVVDVAAREEAGVAEYAFRDNGIGIPPDRLETVFKPLKRLNGFEFPGAGMGLTIARRIVEAHGGSIRIESGDEGGTVVKVRLPRADAE